MLIDVRSRVKSPVILAILESVVTVAATDCFNYLHKISNVKSRVLFLYPLIDTEMLGNFTTLKNISAG